MFFKNKTIINLIILKLNKLKLIIKLNKLKLIIKLNILK